MVRIFLMMDHVGVIRPTDKLDPRYHPLGQPGKRIPYCSALLKVPTGLRVPATVLAYCITCWGLRHWTYPHGPRTIYNVQIPIYDPRAIEYVWDQRFRQQEDIFRNGHVYYAMQEERLRKARDQGLIPNPNEVKSKTK